MKKMLLFWLLPGLLLYGFSGAAQDIEAALQDKKLRVSGGVNLTQTFYGVSGIESRRDPYNYFLTGNLNFSMLGFSIPLSFSFTNQQFSFSQPFTFNQIGVQPSYRWVKLYGGYNSMNFSNYTMNGHLFLGGGFELTPDKWNVAGMYGRLQKAVLPNESNNNIPAFERRGYGVKLGYQNQGDKVELILFGAKDLENSLPLEDSTVAAVLDEQGIAPQENVALGLNLAKTIAKRLVIDAELAGSALTQDTRIQEENTEAGNLFAPFIRRKTSTSYYQAIKTNLNYNADKFSVGIGYERVDPEYKTLGAYFFNNDLENMTLNFSTRFFQDKLTLATNLGTQRNNLNDDKLDNTQRFSGAINIGYTPGERLNFSGTYSNFQTVTRIRSQFDIINQVNPFENLSDSLNFTQVSQNAGLNTNIRLSNVKTRPQYLNLNVSYQDARDTQGDIDSGSDSQFWNGNLSYNLQFTELGMGIMTALNANYSETPDLFSATFGPTLGINKTFFKKKLRTSFSSSFNQAYSNEVLQSSVLNFRLSNSFTLREKHRFLMSMVLLNRRATQTNTQAFTEFTGTLGYSYSF